MQMTQINDYLLCFTSFCVALVIKVLLLMNKSLLCALCLLYSLTVVSSCVMNIHVEQLCLDDHLRLKDTLVSDLLRAA